MITQISLTAWIVCTAKGIYASQMDYICIAYGSHVHCGQKQAVFIFCREERKQSLLRGRRC